uniref:CCHC-type domain-containing protein n=1 Tax=Brassica oleracea var. oleracea TaxID=109376 RepID=A0A0D3DKI5_BRAOL
MLDDDEKRVINGDRPFTKAKRSNCDMLDWNKLQTYASLEKMLHKTIFAEATQKEGKHQHFFCTKTTIKAVKTTSKAHSTRCFKCHRIGHYANKCQNQKPMGQIKNKTAVIKQTKKDLLPFKGRTKLKPMDQYMECKTRSRPTRPRSMPHVAQSIPGPNLSSQLLVSKRNCQLAPRSILNLDQVIQSEVPFP